MNQQLYDRYSDYTDEKLFSILIAKRGEFQEKAIETARVVLVKRGHTIDFEKLFFEKFEKYFDEDLFQILSMEKRVYPNVALKVITGILTQRGHEVEEIDKTNKQAREKIEKSANYKPLLIGVILVVINFYFANVIDEYNFTGRGPDLLIRYLRSAGIFHDIMLRALVILVIIHYIQKQKRNYLLLWIVAGVAFGGWALIVVGILELMTDEPKTEPRVKDTVNKRHYQ